MIFLLAARIDWPDAWPQKRLGDQELVKVQGKPLIKRTLDQIAEMVSEVPIVVSHKPGAIRLSTVWFTPEEHYSYVDTIRSTIPMWYGRCLFINGDVVWHPKALRFVLRNKRSPAIYGNSLGYADGFAFNDSHRAEIEEHLGNAYRPSPSQVHFLRRLAGHSRLEKSSRFVQIPETDPPTMDIDIEKDYQKCQQFWS